MSVMVIPFGWHTINAEVFMVLNFCVNKIMMLFHNMRGVMDLILYFVYVSHDNLMH